MNPSTAFARVLVDELVRGGVRHAVLSPGSRSAPVALALADEPRLTLHVRIDERSAGFFALGVAVETGAPVAVVCTSGTAVANLHPAVLEASFAGVPLVLLTADRPPELRGTGANQTIDQTRIYGGAVRVAVEVGVPERRTGAVGYWRSVTARALAAATDPRHPGPVHLNLALREPLVPDGDRDWPEPLDGARPGAWTTVPAPLTAPPRVEDVFGGPPPERGAVVLGHGAADPREAMALAAALGWPLLSEPSGNGGAASVPAFPLLLADPAFAAAMAPDVVIVVGKPGLSRSLLGWIAGADRQVVVDPRPDWADPTRNAAVVVPRIPAAPEADPRRAGGWLDTWRRAGWAARTAVDAILDRPGPLTEPRLARDLLAVLPTGATLLAGSSRPIRDLEAYAVLREDVDIHANRGVSGIDGLVSTALGIAAAGRRPTYALLGDLAFLHDHNGLLVPPAEPRPPLRLVVVDNDGGGIFSLLPQAGQDKFERVFGTPHGLDVAAVARAAGWPCLEITLPAELGPALAEPGIVVVRTDRHENAALQRHLQQSVGQSLLRP